MSLKLEFIWTSSSLGHWLVYNLWLMRYHSLLWFRLLEWRGFNLREGLHMLVSITEFRSTLVLIKSEFEAFLFLLIVRGPAE